MSHPNILFIMTDQQRADTLSGTWVDTPNLDRIATEGIRFDNCLTTSPVCISTRYSLATGWYPHNTGLWFNKGGHTMAADTPTWMQTLRQAGYRTSLFGKTHLHPHYGDLRDREYLMRAYGFDDIDETGGPRANARCRSHMTDAWEAAGVLQAYQDDYAERFANNPCVVRPAALPLELYYDVYVATQAASYLRNYDRAEPWFCMLSFPGPHEPWDTPEPYASQYDPAAMPAAAPAPRSMAGRPQGVLDHLQAEQQAMLRQADIPAMRADYAGNVSLIDAQIGRVLDVIADRGELDNTVIIFTSDHGEMNGDAGLVYKANFLDGSARVPLLIRTPETLRGVQAGQVSSAFVEWIDLGPTVVELAGGEITYQQFGQSLTPTLTDPQQPHRPDALCEISGEVMLLTEQWKAALNTEGQVYLLFDRHNDPGESENLAGQTDMPPIETELRLRILERIVQSQVRHDLH